MSALGSLLLQAAGEGARWALRKGIDAAKRLRRQRKHAQTPVTPRGCPQCKEIAYTPGQLSCFKCGGRL